MNSKLTLFWGVTALLLTHKAPAKWSSALPRMQIAPSDESDARHADPSGSASLCTLIWGWPMGKTTLNSSLRPLKSRAEKPRCKVVESGPNSPNGGRFPIQVKQQLAEHFLVG